MNKKEIAEFLEIEVRTLYNWEKKRPKLYAFIENSLNIEKESFSKKKKLLEMFENLTEIEQEFYLAEIKTRILKRKLEEKQ